MREGRAIAGVARAAGARLDALSLDGRRRQAIAWTSAHTPDQVRSLLMRTELCLLGPPARRRLPAAWGAADTPRSGCLCLALSEPAIGAAIRGPGRLRAC